MVERPRVAIPYKSMPAYRIEFFSALASELGENGVDLDLYYGDPISKDRSKGDARPIPCGTFRHNRTFGQAGKEFVWQPVYSSIVRSDLVIVEQANRLLLNHVMQARRMIFGAPKFAFWGHGRNMQVATTNSVRERVKSRYSVLADWWFAYTGGVAQHLLKIGYPSDRITVVQNAIDTTKLREDIAALSREDLRRFRLRFGLSSANTALFMGSLYEEKRLRYLVESAEEVGQHIPDFRLIVAGDGPQAQEICEFARSSKVVTYLGRLDGRDRCLALACSQVLLMPGLVGLAILDAFAAGVPVITCADSKHSPEIEYLENEVNGRVLPPGRTRSDYAEVVVGLLRDSRRLKKLQSGAFTSAGSYTVEGMVDNFVQGVMLALDSGRIGDDQR